jgi:hypothetical protein
MLFSPLRIRDHDFFTSGNRIVSTLVLRFPHRSFFMTHASGLYLDWSRATYAVESAASTNHVHASASR